jgi:hypothetical protein
VLAAVAEIDDQADRQPGDKGVQFDKARPDIKNSLVANKPIRVPFPFKNAILLPLAGKRLKRGRIYQQT